MVTRLPPIEHAPAAVMMGVVLALVEAVTGKVDRYGALGGAPVNVTVGVAWPTV